MQMTLRKVAALLGAPTLCLIAAMIAAKADPPISFSGSPALAANLIGSGTGVNTWLVTPSSANLRAALTDESGTGLAYFQGGDLGTPSAGVLTNATGLPIGGLTGLGTGVATALGNNMNAAGGLAPVSSPTLVTPALGVATATSLAIAGCTIGSDVLCITGSANLPTLQAAIIRTGAGATSSNFFSTTGANAAQQTGADVKIGGVNTFVRVGFDGNSNPSVTAANSYAGIDVGIMTATEAGSGTHPIMAAMSVNGLTITNGVGATTDATTFYILGPPTGITPTNPVTSLWVGSGTVKISGLTTGTNADFVCADSTLTLLVQTSACTISSLRFKDVIPGGYRDDALAALGKLDPIVFTMKPGKHPNPDPNFKSRQIGLAAENVAKVEPRCAVYENDMRTPKSYRQECVIAMLVRGEQELAQRGGQAGGNPWLIQLLALGLALLGIAFLATQLQLRSLRKRVFWLEVQARGAGGDVLKQGMDA